MGDKVKDKSKAGVAAHLEACGAPDTTSRGISAGIISGNLASGAKGVDDITRGARLPDNVGKCVADIYDGKQPTAWEKFGTQITSLSGAFKEAADSLKGGAKPALEGMVMDGVNAVTNNTPDKLRAHPEKVKAAISMEM